MDQHLRALSAGQCAGNPPTTTVLESYLQGKGRARSGSGGTHNTMGSSSAKAQAQGLAAQWGGHQQWGEVYSAAVAAAMVCTFFLHLTPSMSLVST